MLKTLIVGSKLSFYFAHYEFNRFKNLYIITWLSNGFEQQYELTNCKRGYGYFSMNSPIYRAIEDGTFVINLGYGIHKFKVTQK